MSQELRRCVKDQWEVAGANGWHFRKQTEMGTQHHCGPGYQKLGSTVMSSGRDMVPSWVWFPSCVSFWRKTDFIKVGYSLNNSLNLQISSVNSRHWSSRDQRDQIYEGKKPCWQDPASTQKSAEWRGSQGCSFTHAWACMFTTLTERAAFEIDDWESSKFWEKLDVGAQCDSMEASGSPFKGNSPEEIRKQTDRQYLSWVSLQYKSK